MIEIKIFSGKNSENLARKIAESYGTTLGEYSARTFSDGEISVKFDENIRGHDVFIIQSTDPPADNLLELLLMIDAARRASANDITVVVPYFGYARQDRKDQPRVAIAAKLIANLIVAAGADRLMTCDLHAGQIQGFFDFPVDHLYGSAIFVPYLSTLNLSDMVFAAPDVGSVSRARGYAKYFGADIVVCDKYRKRANEIISMQVIGEVKDKHVILVDDMIDTGGTLTRAAKVVLDKGALSVRATCTHPVLSGNAYETVENSDLIELVVSDSIPLKGELSKIKVLTLAELFAEGIKRIHNNESISSLFI
ncbi:MAG: ribose-phosphate pyrophosphokinase [Bacteroidetes bacterium]|nr:ribose-phosphate pyrophosphokinase [Bacteroidota bacterium]MCZ6899562.1 ribose-phosphate pyrophosphokinase [Bacteroidota bacterium]